MRPLTEPTISVSPQTAGPLVPERGIGPGGVSACSAMPGSEKVQPARQSWRFQGGQDTIERHAGLDVVMEKIDPWEQAIPSRERETAAAEVMEGPGESSPRSGVRRGRAPRQPQCITLGRLAPRHFALRRRPRCPASHAAPTPAEHLSRYRNRAGIRSPLFRGTRPHGGSRSRTARSSRNLLLSSKAVEATAMVSSRDRLSQGPGSGQVTAYSDTYGRHRMPVDRMGRTWKHPRPEDYCRRLNHRAKAPWSVPP